MAMLPVRATMVPGAGPAGLAAAFPLLIWGCEVWGWDVAGLAVALLDPFMLPPGAAAAVEEVPPPGEGDGAIASELLRASLSVVERLWISA
jgi:hypothetical protein